jgi:hypothetical protein
MAGTIGHASFLAAVGGMQRIRADVPHADKETKNGVRRVGYLSDGVLE